MSHEEDKEIRSSCPSYRSGMCHRAAMASSANPILLLDWQAEGRELFGPETRDWKFVCPNCGTVQDMTSFANLGLHPRQIKLIVGFSCVRIWTDKGCFSVGEGPTILEISEGELRATFAWAPNANTNNTQPHQS